MKLFGKLGLTPQQLNIIGKVIKYSVIGCILAIVGAWTFQTGRIQYIARRKNMEVSATKDIETFYDKKSKDLLPVDIEAHNFSSDWYLKNGQPGKAINHILRVLPVQRTNRKLRLALATAYLQAGQYQKSLECFLKLSEENINDSISTAVAARMGLTLFYLGKIEESEDQLNKCLITYPTSAEAACYLGEVKAATDPQPAVAESFFEKSIHLDSNYVEAWYQRARLHMNRGDYTTARSYLQRILEIEPLHAKTHSRLGMVYYYLDQPEMAKKSYETALAINPDDFNTHYNFGELYYSKYNDKKNALEEFKKALRGAPRHVEANFKVGLICLSNDMVKEAIRYFTRAKEDDPDNIRLLLQLGVAYEKLNMKEDAIRIYRSILDIDALNEVAQQKIKLLSSS